MVRLSDLTWPEQVTGTLPSRLGVVPRERFQAWIFALIRCRSRRSQAALVRMRSVYGVWGSDALRVKRRVRAAIIESRRTMDARARGRKCSAHLGQSSRAVGLTRVVVSRVIKAAEKEEMIRMDGRTLRRRLDGRL
jgi:hypothetical protein